MDKPRSEILNDEQLLKTMAKEAHEFEQYGRPPKHQRSQEDIERRARKNRSKNKQARASRKKNR